MDTDKISNWVQIIASLGMVAGLVLVGLQMKQNEELLRLQIMTNYYTSYVESDSAYSWEQALAFQKSIEDPENLTMAEMRIMESQGFDPLLRWINLYDLNKAGLIDDVAWKNQVGLDAQFYYGTPWGRAWWNVNNKLMVDIFIPRELRDFIQAEINKVDVYNVSLEYEKMKAATIEYHKQQLEKLKAVDKPK